MSSIRFLQFEIKRVLVYNSTIFYLTDLFILYLFIQNVHADKKVFKKGKKLCLMSQILIESHSFLEYWQNRALNPHAVRFFFEVEYKKYDFRLSHFRHIKFKRDTKHLFKSKKNIWTVSLKAVLSYKESRGDANYPPLPTKPVQGWNIFPKFVLMKSMSRKLLD